MDAHLPGDAREERQRQLHHRVEPDEAADARVHLLDGDGGVTAAEGMHPPFGGDGVGHELRGAADLRKLRRLDVVDHRAHVGEPLLGEH